MKEWLRPYYLKWFYFRLHPERRAPGWEACWEAPEVMPAPGDGRDVLFLPMVDWHARIQRSMHLARSLVKLGWRCFYLNHHLGREFPQPYGFGKPLTVRNIERGVFEIHVHLRREPVFHHRLLRPEESAAIRDALRMVLDRPPLIIASFPVWADVALGLQRSALVYDCHDLLAGFPNVARELVDAEPAFLQAADLVTFSSEALARRFPVKRSLILRNAVDPGHFGRASAVRQARTTVGYIGSLSSWFDTESVELAVRTRPEWRFVFAGRVEDESIRVLERYPNVRFIGELPYEQLPDLMAGIGAGLLPRRINPLTEAMNPIKLYEYFACGIPVVSSALPEVEPYAGLAYIARNPAEFVLQLEAAMRETDPQLRQQRLQVAKRESWHSRAAALLAELNL